MTCRYMEAIVIFYILGILVGYFYRGLYIDETTSKHIATSETLTSSNKTVSSRILRNDLGAYNA